MASTPEAKNITVTLDWNPELDAVAGRLAQKAGQPKDEWLKRLLVNALEDAEDAADADEVLSRIQSGEERIYSSEEMRRELGLDDGPLGEDRAQARSVRLVDASVQNGL